VMFDELFSIELGKSRDARRRRMIQEKAWESRSCPGHIGLIAV
jgi:hypothetical protein